MRIVVWDSLAVRRCVYPYRYTFQLINKATMIRPWTIDGLATATAKGKAFEELCVRHISAMPHVAWAKLYAAKDLAGLKAHYGLPNRDKGVDGIYLCRSGKHGLFQSKYRSCGRTTFNDIRGGLGAHDRISQRHELAPYIFLTNGTVPKANRNDRLMNLDRDDVLFMIINCLARSDFQSSISTLSGEGLGSRTRWSVQSTLREQRHSSRIC
jgi:hypothetical protein